MNTQIIDEVEFTKCKITNDWDASIPGVHIHTWEACCGSIYTGWTWLVDIKNDDAEFRVFSLCQSYHNLNDAAQAAITWVKDHNFLN